MQTHMVIDPYYLLLVAWILQSVILLLFVNHSQTNAEKPARFSRLLLYERPRIYDDRNCVCIFNRILNYYDYFPEYSGSI